MRRCSVGQSRAPASKARNSPAEQLVLHNKSSSWWRDYKKLHGNHTGDGYLSQHSQNHRMEFSSQGNRRLGDERLLPAPSSPDTRKMTVLSWIQRALTRVIYAHVLGFPSLS